MVKKAIAGLSLDNNYLSFSFAVKKKQKVSFYLSSTEKLKSGYLPLENFIRDHIEVIQKHIKKYETKHKFRTDRIFFGLPSQFVGRKLIEEVVSLKGGRRKKITYKDIISARDKIENIALDWDQMCLHNLVFEYEIAGETFAHPPLGAWASKLRVKALVLFIKRALYEDFSYIFGNINRKFCGFIYQPIADYSLAYGEVVDNPSFVVHIKHNITRIFQFHGKKFINEKTFPLGERDLINSVAKKFSFSQELAESVIFRYGSFAAVPLDKEVTIKNNDFYLNLSLNSLNQVIKDKIKQIIENIKIICQKEAGGTQIPISLIGKITYMDGFYDFISKYGKGNIKRPLFMIENPTSFGCIYYGIKRFLEQEEKEASFWDKLLKIYREYF